MNAKQHDPQSAPPELIAILYSSSILRRSMQIIHLHNVCVESKEDKENIPKKKLYHG